MLLGKLEKINMKRMLMNSGGREFRVLVFLLFIRGVCVVFINRYLKIDFKLS